jgi:hypothetical protein
MAGWQAGHSVELAMCLSGQIFARTQSTFWSVHIVTTWLASREQKREKCRRHPAHPTRYKAQSAACSGVVSLITRLIPTVN